MKVYRAIKMNESLQSVQRGLNTKTPPRSPTAFNCKGKASPDSVGIEDESNLSFQLSKSSISIDLNLKLKASRSFVNSFKTISDKSINATIVGEMETDTKKDLAQFSKELLKENQIHFTSFATPNKIFCLDCEKEVYSIVKAKPVRPRVLGLQQFFSRIICCESKDESEKEMLHYCSHCNRVLARVLSRL